MRFEAFYRETYPDLVRLLCLATLDSEAAAEIAQESLMAAWQRWETLSTEKPAAWVRTVALNRCRSRWRRSKTDLAARRRLSTSAISMPIGRDLDLINALAALSIRQRQAIVLHYWGDLTVDQCAELMRASAGTVKKHLSRGRSQLAGILTSHDEEDPLHAADRRSPSQSRR